MTRAKPTLGYPTQAAAIEALYAGGERDCNAIAESAGVAINVVHKVLSGYRKLHKIPTPARDYKNYKISPGKAPDAVWGMWDDDRRQAFHARSVAAARAARMAPHE